MIAFCGEGIQDQRARGWTLFTAWWRAQSLFQPQRIIVVLPPHLRGTGTIAGPLRRSPVLSCPDEGDGSAYTLLAVNIRDRIAALAPEEGPPTPRPAPPAPRWMPAPRTGAARFVGRTTQLWALHERLARFRGPASAAPASVVRINGTAGSGKTLLALEYALRFEAAWPGGIFWIRHGGPCRDAILREVAPADLERLPPYLWVVDDLPSTTADQPTAYCAPTPNGTTLCAVRDLAPRTDNDRLAIGALSPPDGLSLLSARTAPRDVAETSAAWRLLDAADAHPYATALIGAAVGRTSADRPFAATLDAFELPPSNTDRLADALADLLPGSARAPVARALLVSLRDLEAEAQDVLFVASHHPAAEITLEEASTAIGRLDDAAPALAMQRLLAGLAQLQRRALVDRTGPGLECSAILKRATAVAWEGHDRLLAAGNRHGG